MRRCGGFAWRAPSASSRPRRFSSVLSITGRPPNATGRPRADRRHRWARGRDRLLRGTPLFDWLFDDRWVVALILGLAGIGCVFAWWRTRKKQYLYGLAAVVVLAT